MAREFKIFVSIPVWCDLEDNGLLSKNGRLVSFNSSMVRFGAKFAVIK